MALSVYAFLDWTKSRKPGIKYQQIGCILVFLSAFSLLLYSSIDPGFVISKQNGTFSQSLQAGLTTLLFLGAAFSGCASGVLVAFWISLLDIYAKTRIFHVTLKGLIASFVIFVWYFVLAIVLVLSVAYFPSTTTTRAIVGLISLMTVVTGVLG